MGHHLISEKLSAKFRILETNAQSLKIHLLLHAIVCCDKFEVLVNALQVASPWPTSKRWNFLYVLASYDVLFLLTISTKQWHRDCQLKNQVKLLHSAVSHAMEEDIITCNSFNWYHLPQLSVYEVVTWNQYCQCYFFWDLKITLEKKIKIIW